MTSSKLALPPLSIVPAGAGSGKTYSIQQLLGCWVEEGHIAPERIVAVTFTEAAAAELRERIRAKLLELGRLDDALKIDRAYISTIHGFGLRLLTEFSFDTGLTPRPRLLNEDEENTLIRLALSQTDKADVITANLSKFGYRFDFNSKKSAEEMFRDNLLHVVTQLRSLGWSTVNNAYSEKAVAWIKEKYGTTFNNSQLTEQLHQAVKSLVEAFPQNLADDFGTSNAGKKDLAKDFRNLQKALDIEVLSSDWKLWQDLRNLRQSKRGAALPEGYDGLTNEVIDAANALPNHPGPLQQATTHIDALLAAGQDVLVQYAEAKKEAGLVDYSDMIAMAGHLLRTRKDVLATLVDRIDCLVVDEFQDTNPLQFSLLWSLKEAGVPTVTVGDMKQAIMGFQGADPRLFEALIDQNPIDSKPLTQNWRSCPEIMHFVNAVGPGLFGDAYVSLDPQGKGSDLEPLEFISFPKKAKKGQHVVRASSVGDRLKVLLADKNQKIVDRRTKVKRSLRGSDVAILCPTHKMLSEYADVLRDSGFRVKLQEDGWFASREIQIACQALAYVANPSDRHAALYLSVTELGNSDLAMSLNQLIKDESIDDSILDELNTLAEKVAERTIYALVSDTFEALNLFDAVSQWPNADQARANLLRLLAEAGEFMDANREALASGGYYGSGIQSFLAWLNAKVDLKDKDFQPDPRVLDEEAIQLITWHSSKGREWPVVFVCGMDRTIKASTPKMALGYSSFENLSEVINQAQIQYSPKFSAPEADERFLSDLNAEIEVEQKRLLYVAMTRARDKLVLEWPAYMEGKEPLTHWKILTEDAGLKLGKDTVEVGAAFFPCTVTEGLSSVPDESVKAKESGTRLLKPFGRRAIEASEMVVELTPDNVTPSGIVLSSDKGSDTAQEVSEYDNELKLDIDLKGAELGTLLHLCFEVLGSNPPLIDRLPEITGFDLNKECREEISGKVEKFEKWLLDRFGVESIQRELPLLFINDNGSVVSGTADMVVTTKEGDWIIDHKSDQVTDTQETFNHYRPQLDCYAAALRKEGRKVLGVGINWIRRGEVSLAKF